MRSLTRLPFALLALSFCFLVSTEAQADPLVIDSGFIFNQGIGSSFSTFNFSGPAISVNANARDTLIGARTCFQCTSLTPITLTPFASFVGGGGTVVLNGTTYSSIFTPGILRFSGPSFTLPATTSDPILSITVPFQMTGDLSGDTFNPFIGTQTNIVFSTTLVGQGLVTFQFGVTHFNGFTFYSYLNSTYNFQPAPVPEPVTILLFGTGLAGVAARVRKRRKASN